MFYLVKNIACDSKYSIVSNIGPGLEAVAQKEESEGQWFVLQTPPPPPPPPAACGSILGLDSRIHTPDCCSVGVWMAERSNVSGRCVAPDEQVGTSHGRNVCFRGLPDVAD